MITETSPAISAVGRSGRINDVQTPGVCAFTLLKFGLVTGHTGLVLSPKLD